MKPRIQIGIDSFAAAHDDASRALSPSKRLSNLIDEIEHADRVGLDVFGIGEHHRKDFLDSAPAVILAAAATRTSRIRLTSAVTVLGSADPVRVFQNFATLDLISQGRAEMVVGRGSFIDSFPLFGLRLEDYHSPFPENLDLLPNIRDNDHARAFNDIGKERGWPPVPRASFDAQRGPHGALVIGSPDEVVEKIIRHSEALGGVSRFTFQMNAASLPHAKLMQAIELLGARVAPALRKELAGSISKESKTRFDLRPGSSGAHRPL